MEVEISCISRIIINLSRIRRQNGPQNVHPLLTVLSVTREKTWRLLWVLDQVSGKSPAKKKLITGKFRPLFHLPSQRVQISSTERCVTRLDFVNQPTLGVLSHSLFALDRSIKTAVRIIIAVCLLFASFLSHPVSKCLAKKFDVTPLQEL